MIRSFPQAYRAVKLLMWVTIAAAPLILLLRRQMRAIPKEAMEAAVE